MPRNRLFRNPSKLYARFGFLFSDVETSCGVGSDWPPTAQAIEVHELLKERLRTYQGQFRVLMSDEVAAFNSMLAANNVKGLFTLQP